MKLGATEFLKQVISAVKEDKVISAVKEDKVVEIVMSQILKKRNCTKLVAFEGGGSEIKSVFVTYRILSKGGEKL